VLPTPRIATLQHVFQNPTTAQTELHLTPGMLCLQHINYHGQFATGYMLQSQLCLAVYGCAFQCSVKEFN
jgi:hypothetical protein